MNDIRSALSSRRIKYTQNVNNRSEICICCLFCVERGESQDHKFRLGINIAKNLAHCFNCGWGSRNAAKALAYRLGLGAIDGFDDVEEKKVPKPRLPRDFEILLGKQSGYWGKLARKYLAQRGVSDYQIKRNKIGYSLIGRYAYRIVFPVYVNDKLEGLVARAFGNQEPRYLNTPGIKTLYNWRKSGCEIAVLSEGVFKSLAIERALLMDSFALLGHSMTEAQEELLRSNKHLKEVVLWPDPDKPGIRGMLVIANELSTRLKVSVVWPLIKQADEMAVADIENCFGRRRPFTTNLALEMQSDIQRRD